MDAKRACPVCASCGGRKFVRLAVKDATAVRCENCGRDMKI